MMQNAVTEYNIKRIIIKRQTQSTCLFDPFERQIIECKSHPRPACRFIGQVNARVNPTATNNLFAIRSLPETDLENTFFLETYLVETF